MNFQKNNWLFIAFGIIIGALVMHFCSNYTITKKDNQTNYSTQQTAPPSRSEGNVKTTSSSNISELSSEKNVADYVKQNHRLPDFYITKSEARQQGWNPSQGNLCDVLPGRVIGGDKFSNREGNLPQGKRYYEADVNFECGHRQADRLIYTSDGEVWVTHDHYKSFQKQ